MKKIDQAYMQGIKSKIDPRYHENYEDRFYLSENPYTLQSLLRGQASEGLIKQDTKILAFGSCFAQEVTKWLRERRYKVKNEEWGVIYNVKQFEQLVKMAVDPNGWCRQENAWRIDGRYFFPYLKSPDHSGPLQLGGSEQEAKEILGQLYIKTRDAFREADVIIFTLGMTEVWRNNATGNVYFAQPGVSRNPMMIRALDPRRHEFHNMTVGEVLDSLKFIVDTLSRLNEKIKFVFSVSPVPLQFTYSKQMSAYVANSRSKSTLLSAVFETVERNDNVYYMPSYEIIRNAPQLAYEEDGRHILPAAVDIVMRAFETLYVRGQN